MKNNKKISINIVFKREPRTKRVDIWITSFVSEPVAMCPSDTAKPTKFYNKEHIHSQSNIHKPMAYFNNVFE